MRDLKTKRSAARAKARELLAATADEDDKAIVEAAQSDPDAGPLDDERLKKMSPMASTDAAELARRARGRPRSPAPKRLVSLRLDPDVVARFRASGPGWQTRINEVLREHLPKSRG
ncbi:MAG: BrnA antitoxin family protein [Caulobacteraceae bacterium]